MGFSKNSAKQADNYQETWVAADWKSADKQQVTIGPLYHFTNRINEVDNWAQRGGLALNRLSTSSVTAIAAHARKI